MSIDDLQPHDIYVSVFTLILEILFPLSKKIKSSWAYRAKKTTALLG